MTKLRILALTYKTFPRTLSAVREATIDALRRMGMRVLPNGSAEDGATVTILASGWRRELDVELEAQGPKSTRVRVLAKEGVFFEDNTASDLIAHVTRLLEDPSDVMVAGHAARTADHMMAFSPDAPVTLLSR